MKSDSVFIQMRATTQYFPVVPFTMLWMKSLSAIIQIKAKQYFPAVLFIALNEVVLIMVKLDYSNESYWVIHSCRTVIMLYIKHD